MKKNQDLTTLQKCPLFKDMGAEQIAALLDCLAATEQTFAKDSVIFLAGQRVSTLGVVLSGAALLVQDDYWGRRGIIDRIEPAGLFGEAFACSQEEKLPVSVLAAEDCAVMFLDYRRVVTTCSNTCRFHSRLISNMLAVLAVKNVHLVRKMEHLTRRGIRGKVLSYLSAEALRVGSGSFEIPFNRQELADYLAIERTALSAELSKMQREGLLQYSRNYFELPARN